MRLLLAGHRAVCVAVIRLLLRIAVAVDAHERRVARAVRRLRGTVTKLRRRSRAYQEVVLALERRFSSPKVCTHCCAFGSTVRLTFPFGSYDVCHCSAPSVKESGPVVLVGAPGGVKPLMHARVKLAPEHGEPPKYWYSSVLRLRES